jgi:hypothetical protein
MYLAIIKKVEGRWIVDIDSNHIFEPEGVVFEDGAYQEIKIARITPLLKHPNEPTPKEEK